jgi:hypothetical protein
MEVLKMGKRKRIRKEGVFVEYDERQQRVQALLKLKQTKAIKEKIKYQKRRMAAIDKHVLEVRNKDRGLAEAHKRR